MQTLSRFTLLFGAPALLMAAASLAVWLALGSAHNDLGPMRLTPLPPPSTISADDASGAPPPNRIQRMSPAEAELRNALLPFTRSGLGAGAAYRPTAGLAASATECLTQAVYYEAAREPDVGQRAVAQVVLNRVASTSFPKTVCGVVQQGAGRPGCQFTFMCDGSLEHAPNVVLWSRARTVAEAALSGYVEPSVGDATHYHADYVFPLWAPEMVKLTKIGRHIFYHWRRAAPLAPSASEAARPALDVVVPSAQELAPLTSAVGTRVNATNSSVSTGTPQPGEPKPLVETLSSLPVREPSPTSLPIPSQSPGITRDERQPRRALPERSLVGTPP